ncbi:hypothetical protein NDU88_001831 [Pleurodeles waltl]|uniref:Uncharacterized protein n=1 Tax=Pleurodeles waltl TaxID=8319 RepID=A0AAV7U7L2_PLEWA|nr:hypothetical protein NDU88_001831 [Pleurodeles waltl]
MKVVLQGICIKISYVVRRQLERIHELKMWKLEAILSACPQKMLDWHAGKTEILEGWHRLKKHTCVAYRQRLHMEGNKSGAMLTRLVKRESAESPILTLHSEAVALVCMQKVINGVFGAYLRNAYSEKLHPSPDDLRGFLTEIQLPCLDPVARETLDSLLIREQILDAIRRLKATKTLGIHGLLGDFYHKYAEVVAYQLLEVYDEAPWSRVLSASMCKTLVVMILKPSRDPPHID